MPKKPLIFVEVALVSGMSSNVQSLLDKSALVVNSKDVNAAIFYSTFNAQKELGGGHKFWIFF
jgi:malonyl-CoA decarboxylase